MSNLLKENDIPKGLEPWLDKEITVLEQAFIDFIEMWRKSEIFFCSFPKDQMFKNESCFDNGHRI